MMKLDCHDRAIDDRRHGASPRFVFRRRHLRF